MQVFDIDVHGKDLCHILQVAKDNTDNGSALLIWVSELLTTLLVKDDPLAPQTLEYILIMARLNRHLSESGHIQAVFGYTFAYHLNAKMQLIGAKLIEALLTGTDTPFDMMGFCEQHGIKECDIDNLINNVLIYRQDASCDCCGKQTLAYACNQFVQTPIAIIKDKHAQISLCDECRMFMQMPF